MKAEIPDILKSMVNVFFLGPWFHPKYPNHWGRID